MLSDAGYAGVGPEDHHGNPAAETVCVLKRVVEAHAELGVRCDAHEDNGHEKRVARGNVDPHPHPGRVCIQAVEKENGVDVDEKNVPQERRHGTANVDAPVVVKVCHGCAEPQGKPDGCFCDKGEAQIDNVFLADQHGDEEVDGGSNQRLGESEWPVPVDQDCEYGHVCDKGQGNEDPVCREPVET